MLSFLNTIVLPALLAISIPIIIHFFNRRKVKKIPFSSLRFLKLLENQRIKQVRLYQILLIIIRTLFILFLILAFARPTFNATYLPSAGTARTTAVILLDDSYSMNAFEKSMTKFQLTLDYLKKILNSFDPADQVFILPASSPTENLGMIGLNQDFSELIKRYSVTNSMPDYSNALKNAENIFKAYPNFNKELYLLTDMRLNSFHFPDSIPDYFHKESLKYFIVNPENDSELNNLGIDTVIAETQLFEVNKPVRFKVKLHNYHTDDALEGLISLFIEEKRVSIDQLIVPPAREGEIDISYIPQKAGYQLLHFELEDDALLADNHYYFNYAIPINRKILFVGNNLKPELQTALETLDKETSLVFEFANFAQWVGKTIEKYDLIVLYDPPAMNQDQITRLKQYTTQNNILLIPGVNQTVGQLNAFSNSLAGKNIILNLQSSSDETYYYPLDPNLTSLPLFSPIFTNEPTETDLPRISRYFKLSKNIDPIFSLKNGDPVFAKIQTASGGYLYILSTMIDMEWNDFPVKGFFLPMLYRILYTTAQTYQDEKNLVVNDDYIVNLPVQPIQNFMLKISDNEPFEIFPEQSSSGIQFHFEKLSKPGHYTISTNNTIIHAFTVNLDSRELKFPYIEINEFLGEVVYLSTEDDFIEQIRSFRTGQELWYIFLVLALLMLISEMLLVMKLERQSSF